MHTVQDAKDEPHDEPVSLHQQKGAVFFAFFLSAWFDVQSQYCQGGYADDRSDRYDSKIHKVEAQCDSLLHS